MFRHSRSFSGPPKNRSKSCLVSLHCGIPYAYKFLWQEHKVYKLVKIELV